MSHRIGVGVSFSQRSRESTLRGFVIQLVVQTKLNYSLNFKTRDNAVRGPGVNSAKIRKLKIPPVDGFGLREKPSSDDQL